MKRITSKPEVIATEKNTNLPKCVNCKLLGCNAGEVNHDVKNNKRSSCLFCNCAGFVELKGK